MLRTKGFGLIELVVTMVVLSLLVSIAVPAYDHYSLQARVAQAAEDIRDIENAIYDYREKHGCSASFSLAVLDIDIPADPWGRPYIFVQIGPDQSIADWLRRDGGLNRLNTDFDLYSMGPDGLSANSLSAMESRDDIVRANNGRFVGLGSDY